MVHGAIAEVAIALLRRNPPRAFAVRHHESTKPSTAAISRSESMRRVAPVFGSDASTPSRSLSLSSRSPPLLPKRHVSLTTPKDFPPGCGGRGDDQRHCTRSRSPSMPRLTTPLLSISYGTRLAADFGLAVSPSPSPQSETTLGNDNEDDDDDNYNHNHDAENLDLQAVARDQACLRISYLVNTMLTPPAVYGGSSGNGQPSIVAAIAPAATCAKEEGAAFAPSCSLVAPGPDRDGACEGAPVWVPTVNGRYPALDPTSDLVKRFASACPRGWSGAKPLNKQRKISMILLWQAEVDALDDATYCACSAGTSTADNDNDHTSGENIDSNAAVATIGPTANSTAPFCTEHGHPLPPLRHIAWISEQEWLSYTMHLRLCQDTASESLWRTLKSIRGLMSKTKRTAVTADTFRDPASPAPPAPRRQRSVTRSTGAVRTPWDLWDQRNCCDLYSSAPDGASAADMHAPRTAMYHDLTSGPPSRRPHQDGLSEDDDDDVNTSSADTQTRQQRRRKETVGRLRRAQMLLAKIHPAGAVES